MAMDLSSEMVYVDALLVSEFHSESMCVCFSFFFLPSRNATIIKLTHTHTLQPSTNHQPHSDIEVLL